MTTVQQWTKDTPWDDNHFKILNNGPQSAPPSTANPTIEQLKIIDNCT